MDAPTRRRGPKGGPNELRRTSWRLGLQTGGLLMATLAFVSLLVVLGFMSSERTEEIDVLDRSISIANGDLGADEVDDAELLGVSTAAQMPGQPMRIIGALPPGLPDLRVMAEVARTGAIDQRHTVIAGHAYAVRTARRGPTTIQAVLDLRPEQEEVNNLVRSVVAGGLAGLVLATIIAIWLTRRAMRPMADALRLQTRFVADAAHELRTPLTLLSTRAQLLARKSQRTNEGVTSSEEAADLRGLARDAHNLTEILEDLLLAADLRTQSLVGTVDLQVIAREAVDAARAEADVHGIRLRLQAETPNLISDGSRTALLRATTALLDNAISHAHSEVAVVVTSDSKSVVIEVIDDGDGFTEDALPTVFDRFAGNRSGFAPPGPAQTGGERRHYGLGLALVSEVAQRHGGRVTATNRHDGTTGAQLRLRLPYRRSARQQARR